jgi:hypothetical protein
MKTFLLCTILILTSTLSNAQLDVPYVKTSFGLNTKNGDYIQGYALEYTHFVDIAKYYSATFYGYTLGIQYNNKRLQVPVQWTVKVSEWNDILRLGVVLDKNINQTDLYASFGFDNQVLRYRTDGWIYTIEGYAKYNQFRTEVGGRIGIGFNYDKYHYNRWYNNY